MGAASSKLLACSTNTEMMAVEGWTCPSCRTPVTTTYCASCGERALRAHDLTLRGLAHQAALAIVSVDGRLVRSVSCLLRHPGELTRAYMRGQRKPYIAPLQLFLVANVLFFAMQSMSGEKILSTSLAGHLQNQVWSPIARRLVTDRLQATHRTFDGYAPVFDRAVALNAKSLIVLMAVAFSASLPVLFHRSRQPFVTHAVFALHFYAFLLLVLCGALTLTLADVRLGGAGLRSDGFDHALSLFILGVCAVYLWVATGAVYRAAGATRVLKVAVLVVGVAGIFLGYRGALLLITLFST